MRILNLGVPRTGTVYAADALQPNIGHGHFRVSDSVCTDLVTGQKVDIDGCYVVGFVRNPFDLLVSHYRVLHEPAFEDHPDAPLAGLHFRDYVTLVCHRYTTPAGVFPTPRKSLFFQLFDATRLVPDYIGRYETLDDDLQRIAGITGAAYTPGTKTNASSRGPYRDFYDAPIAEEVAERFAYDLAMFGYNMDGPTEAAVRFGERR